MMDEKHTADYDSLRESNSRIRANERRSEYEAAEAIRNRFLGVFSWIVAIAGLVASVAGLIFTVNPPEQGSTIMASIVVVDSAFLLAIAVYVIIWKRVLALRNDADYAFREWREQAMLDDHVSKMANLNSEKNEVYKKLECLREIASGRAGELNGMTAVLSRGLYRNSQLLLDAYVAHDQLAFSIEQLASKLNEFEDETRRIEVLAQEFKRYVWDVSKLIKATEADIIRGHNDFMLLLLNKLCESCREQLRSRGIELRVSAALKLFVSPASREDAIAHSLDAEVYTAFRDSETWNEKKRSEIPLRHYSIAGNTDFSHCLSSGTCYLFNNRPEVGSGFLMQSNNLGRFFNCGATALIASECYERDPNAKVYGFLACDVMNPDEEVAVMNDEIGAILSAYARVIALYYDSVDDIWEYFHDSVNANELLEKLGNTSETILMSFDNAPGDVIDKVNDDPSYAFDLMGADYGHSSFWSGYHEYSEVGQTHKES